MSRLLPAVLVLITSSVLSIGLAAAQGSAPQAQRQNSFRAQDLKGGFGKPEMIVGRIEMVDPNQNLIVVAVPKGTQPVPIAVGQTKVTEVTPDDSVYQQVKTWVVRQDNSVNYDFRCKDTSWVKLDGQRARLDALANSKGAIAVVRFVPHAAGNEILSVDGTSH
jgi:hypothetical protein